MRVISAQRIEPRHIIATERAGRCPGVPFLIDNKMPVASEIIVKRIGGASDLGEFGGKFRYLRASLQKLLMLFGDEFQQPIDMPRRPAFA